jgi:murein DD-endopeptidase MepM/ murein hydrolase activator NlpD
MPGRHRSIVIIPPKNARIRLIRIRAGVILGVCIVVMAGFAGYFIPFNSLTLDVVEQNQKKNLAEQNKKLLFRIHGMRQQLHTLNVRLRGLERAREDLNSSFKVADFDTGRIIGGQTIAPLAGDLDTLLAKVVVAENFMLNLAGKLEDDADFFSRAPIIKPVAGSAPITAGFGPRRDPFTGAIKRHYGIDFAVPRETPVRATAKGTVLSVEKHQFWGNRVTIRHALGFKTVYAHLGAVHVGRNRRVDRGDIIGTVGISGLTTGPHLHYEIRMDGEAVDPADFFFPDVADPADIMLAKADE